MPTVLLTHIPLDRPNTASCGPLRERGTIRQGTGYGYENTLSAQASRLLLDSLRPIVVFRYVGSFPGSASTNPDCPCTAVTTTTTANSITPCLPQTTFRCLNTAQ